MVNNCFVLHWIHTVTMNNAFSTSWRLINFSTNQRNPTDHVIKRSRFILANETKTQNKIRRYVCIHEFVHPTSNSFLEISLTFIVCLLTNYCSMACLLSLLLLLLFSTLFCSFHQTSLRMIFFSKKH